MPRISRPKEEFEIYSRSDSRYWWFYYRPRGRKPVRKSTGVLIGETRREQRESKKEAVEVADAWVVDLIRYPNRPDKMTWSAFRKKYSTYLLENCSKHRRNQGERLLNRFQEIIDPDQMEYLSSDDIDTFFNVVQEKRRLSPASRANYGRNLRAAFRFAFEHKLMPQVLEIPKEYLKVKEEQMKGGEHLRPAEMEAMLAAVKRVVGAKNRRHWEFYIAALANCGLRLQESHDMVWDEHDRRRVRIVLGTSAKESRILIPASMDKAGKQRHLPVTPGMHALLCKVPQDERTGFVFKLPNIDRSGTRAKYFQTGKIVRWIGKEAGIVTKEHDHKEEPRYATAHDLRRTFGWTMAQAGVDREDLRKMMRHRSIKTTEIYYAEREADGIADRVCDVLS